MQLFRKLRPSSHAPKTHSSDSYHTGQSEDPVCRSDKLSPNHLETSLRLDDESAIREAAHSPPSHNPASTPVQAKNGWEKRHVHIAGQKYDGVQGGHNHQNTHDGATGLGAHGAGGDRPVQGREGSAVPSSAGGAVPRNPLMDPRGMAEHGNNFPGTNPRMQIGAVSTFPCTHLRTQAEGGNNFPGTNPRMRTGMVSTFPSTQPRVQAEGGNNFPGTNPHFDR